MRAARSRVEEAVASGRSLKEVLQIVIEEARRLVGAATCSVVLLDLRTGELVFFATGGEQSDAPLDEHRFPADRGITGDVVSRGESALVNDPRADPRFYQDIERRSGLETLNLISAPLRFEGQVIGAIDILNKDGGFSDDDLRLLEEFTDSAGRAIGSSKRLADTLRSGWSLGRQLEGTIDHLIRFNR